MIKERDFEQFKSLQLVNLSKLLIKTLEDNPLSEQNKQLFKSINQKNKKIKLFF